jgi:hypothetical protein
VNLHALLTNSAEVQASLPSDTRSLAAVAHRRPRRMKLPKAAIF